jgi:predicted secreted hydrolase
MTLSRVRAADGTYPLALGTYIQPDGRSEQLGSDDFSVEPIGSWTSPGTGTTYPSGWRVRVPDRGLDLTVAPTMDDQELDTRATTAVVYWEGSQRVTGTRDGAPITGEGYVELTGYGPSGVGETP